MTKANHLVGGHRLWSGIVSARLLLPKIHNMKMTGISTAIPARTTRAAPPAAHQGGGDKCATGGTGNKIRARSNIVIGTWNIRTLRTPGKLEELTHEMARYRWHILGIYFSDREDKYKQGVGFLVNKDIVNSVMGCRPISSRLIVIRLRATPFNIPIVQA